MKKHNLIAKFFYFLACFIFGTGIALIPTMAQEDTPPTDAETVEEAYTQGCAECHLDVVADWQTSQHAAAFTSTELQTLIAEGEAGICLDCHATGYQPFSGEFTHAAVTCEACHGQTPADHPDEPVSVVLSTEICGDCHTTTYREWQISAHGGADLDCTSCHDPHSRGLRFETTNELCTNCHEAAELVGYAHETHTEQACSDCHWHHGEFDNAQHVLTGQLYASGHDANVETLACIDCHENEAQTVALTDEDAAAAEDGHGTEAISPISPVRLRELEAEIANVRAQGENVAAVRLLQGGVLGLAFGAVMMFGFIRLRPGQRFEDEE